MQARLIGQLKLLVIEVKGVMVDLWLERPMEHHTEVAFESRRWMGRWMALWMVYAEEFV